MPDLPTGTITLFFTICPPDGRFYSRESYTSLQSAVWRQRAHSSLSVSS
jgi:hypothetical protein